MKLLRSRDGDFLTLKSSRYLWKLLFAIRISHNEPCRGEKCSTEAAISVSELAEVLNDSNVFGNCQENICDWIWFW